MDAMLEGMYYGLLLQSEKIVAELENTQLMKGTKRELTRLHDMTKNIRIKENEERQLRKRVRGIY